VLYVREGNGFDSKKRQADVLLVDLVVEQEMHSIIS
jgi:hypothetical protein